MSNHRAKGIAAVLALVALLAAGPAALAQSGLQKSEIALDIPVVQGSITADGVLDESVWSNAATIAIPEILYVTVDESDLSGTAQVFWNASGLYVAFRVTDDQLLFAGPNDNLWAYDSVSVWLNNVWIQAGLLNDGGARASIDNLAGFPPYEVSYQIGVARDDSGYVVEMFVPANVLESALGFSWTSGSLFAFAVGLADRDEGERTASNPRYFPNWFGWNNTASMAKATLK